MIEGTTINALVERLHTDARDRRDFIAEASAVRMEGGRLIVGGRTYAPTDLMHRQIGNDLQIPARYYDRLRMDRPEMLDANVNAWLEDNSDRRMVRTLRGDGRAWLSDRYRRIDHDAVLGGVLDALVEADARMASLQATDSRLYVQARFPRIEGEVALGQPVQAGVIITNSEVGLGALEVRPLIYVLACTNGMVVPRQMSGGVMRRHLGARDDRDGLLVGHSHETAAAMDRALMLQIRDAVRHLSDPAQFLSLLGNLRESATGTVIENPVAAVRELANTYGLTEEERDGALVTLVRDGDYSRWGALNAVTEQANRHASYDRAVALQEIGGQILTMGNHSWERLAAAA